MSVAKVQVDFAKILAELEADKELQETIREHQKEVDQCSRSIATVLNKIHSTPAAEGEKRKHVDRESRGELIKSCFHCPSLQHYRADASTLCKLSTCYSCYCRFGACESVLQGELHRRRQGEKSTTPTTAPSGMTHGLLGCKEQRTLQLLLFILLLVD